MSQNRQFSFGHRSAAAALCVLVAPIGTSARAADLGGDCCADLEERVAELEATTARKGNRKVSLTISGHINELVMFWDDGSEANAYVTSNNNAASRFRILGKAQINQEWAAGYYLEFDTFSSHSGAVNQLDDDAPGNVIGVRQSNWWLESKQLGRVTVGQGSPSTDDNVLADAEGAAPAAHADINQLGGGFFLRDASGALINTTTLGEFTPGLDTARRNIVRYDSPTVAGFKITASYGEDDFWDVGLWWTGKIGEQLTYVGAVGYLENTDERERIGGRANYQEVKGSASFLHNPTGLFITGAFTRREFDDSNFSDLNFWYLRSGVVARMVPIGKTVFFGELARGANGLNGQTLEAGLDLVSSSELQLWSLGVTQHIDAAAMELYAVYRNFDAEASGLSAGVAAHNDFESLHIGAVGARIKF